MIEVVIEGIDRLTRETWGFWLDDNRIKLYISSYISERRKSTRHKYRAVRFYRHAIQGIPEMQKDDVPLNDGVKALAVEQVMSKLEVLK